MGSPCSSPTNVLLSPSIPLSQQLKASHQEEAGKDATKISVSSNRGSYEVCAWGHRSPNPGTHCMEHRGLPPHGGSFCPHRPNPSSAGPSSATLGAILWGERSDFLPGLVFPIQLCSWDQNEETPISSIKHVLLAVCCCLALLHHPSKRAKRCWEPNLHHVGTAVPTHQWGLAHVNSIAGNECPRETISPLIDSLRGFLRSEAHLSLSS